MTKQAGVQKVATQVAQSPGKAGQYDHLDPNRVLQTIQQLKNRIEERFPQAGLAAVCGELYKVAQAARKTSLSIARPMWGLRLFTYLVILLVIAMPIVILWQGEWTLGKMTLADSITLSEALFNDLILVGAAILFLITIESRVKRRRTLTAVHRLRSIAHIVDMHQLTKDPEKFLSSVKSTDTASSPQRKYTKYELGRYLDYCTEMLSLIGKVGAMYIERFPDGVAVGSVNELESFTTGLSRKIWQKIMILNSEPDQQ